MSDNNDIGALVLGAGKGTRMQSNLPKVLQPILDRPMLYYILQAVRGADIKNSAVVTGHRGSDVEDYLALHWKECTTINQQEQLGTGHAVRISCDWSANFSHIVILPGDVPLICEKTLRRLVDTHLRDKNDCTFITFEPPDPAGYGRVIDSEGHVCIVEEKDANTMQKQVRQVNAGIYIFRTSELLNYISSLSASNSQNEYYLTDLISILSIAGKKVIPHHVENGIELSGINDPIQLSEVTALMKERILKSNMLKGVRIMDPASTFIGPDVSLDQDVFIEPFVQIWGQSSIGKGSRIGSHSIISDSIVDENVEILSHVIIDQCKVGPYARLGPFAFIREGTEISRDSFVGKFVEIKKSSLGKASKVPHLSYIGDATIGDETNIGAGTITCNFDGLEKHVTRIGNRSFIGSDTIIVAPVTIEDETFTAAGSVITRDVPYGALAVSRSKQRNIEGWTQRKDRSRKRRK